jgi:predicted alpha/beta hydrolase family esterase
VSQPILLLPGIGNSGPDHWQTLWQQAEPRMRRVGQHDWEQPQLKDWLEALEAAVAGTAGDAILVAHSLGCLLVAHWGLQTRRKIAGAMLVAPPDPSGPAFPAAARSFAPLPQQRLPFPSMVVASSNDPYGSIAFSRNAARAWGSLYRSVGPCGHINAASGLGHWKAGRMLLWELSAS